MPVNDKPVPAVYVVLDQGTLTYARLFSSNKTAYLVPLSSYPIKIPPFVVLLAVGNVYCGINSVFNAYLLKSTDLASEPV